MKGIKILKFKSFCFPWMRDYVFYELEHQLVYFSFSRVSSPFTISHHVSIARRHWSHPFRRRNYGGRDARRRSGGRSRRSRGLLVCAFLLRDTDCFLLALGRGVRRDLLHERLNEGVLVHVLWANHHVLLRLPVLASDRVHDMLFIGIVQDNLTSSRRFRGCWLV